MSFFMYNVELKPGDILLFKAFQTPTVSQKLISLGAIFSRTNLGDDDTVHAAICIGIQKGKAIIAHVSPTRNGYLCEELDQMFLRDHQQANFLVYRPSEPGFAHLLAKHAMSPDAQHIREYSRIDGVKTVVNSANKGLEEGKTARDSYSKSSFCSKFVVETIELATQMAHEGIEQYQLNIRSNAAPKDLEAALNSKGSLFNCYSCEPNKGKGLHVVQIERSNSPNIELEDMEDKSTTFKETP